MFSGNFSENEKVVDTRRIVIHSDVVMQQQPYDLDQWIKFNTGGGEESKMVLEPLDLDSENFDFDEIPSEAPAVDVNVPDVSTHPTTSNTSHHSNTQVKENVIPPPPKMIPVGGPTPNKGKKLLLKLKKRTAADIEEDDDFVPNMVTKKPFAVLKSTSTSKPRREVPKLLPPAASATSSSSSPREHGQGQSSKNLSMLKQTLRDDEEEDAISVSSGGESVRGDETETDILETPRRVFIDSKNRLKSMKLRNATVRRQITSEIASIDEDMRRMKDELKRMARRRTQKSKKLCELDGEDRQIDEYIRKIDSIVVV